MNWTLAVALAGVTSMAIIHAGNPSPIWARATNAASLVTCFPFFLALARFARAARPFGRGFACGMLVCASCLLMICTCCAFAAAVVSLANAPAADLMMVVALSLALVTSIIAIGVCILIAVRLGLLLSNAPPDPSSRGRRWRILLLRVLGPLMFIAVMNIALVDVRRRLRRVLAEADR